MSSEEEGDLRRGPWTLEEDNLLIHYISCHGEGRWNLLAKCAGLKRTGKSCRLRWLNYLKPDIKRGNLSPQEQLLILELHSKWGNRWSKIAQHLPGRTDNEIKNYWRTRVQKQARQLNVESDSKSFLDAVREFWMPRLVQQMEQTDDTSMNISSSSATTLNSQSTVMMTDPYSVFPQPSSSPSSQMMINYSNHHHGIYENSSSSLTGLTDSPSNSAKLSSDVIHQGVFSADHYQAADHNAAAFTSNYFHNNNSAFPSDDYYYVDANDGYGGDIHMANNMSANGIAFPDCQLADNQWTAADVAEDNKSTIYWNNTDELWQFR